MIIALTTANDGGARTLVVGLSDENWARLRDNQPIPVVLRNYDPALPPITVLLLGGPTEQSIYEDLRAHVRIDQVHGQPPRGDPPP